MMKPRLFILASSEWAEGDWVCVTLSGEDDPGKVWKSLDRGKLASALDSLQANTSVEFHPRASVEEVYSGQQLTVYRSGRIEWNSAAKYPGYDRSARHIWAARERALELWVALLEGKEAILNQADWSVTTDSHCPVCGWELGFHPWGETGDQPTFEICQCCGCEFGINDRTSRQISSYREAWQSKGSPWLFPAGQPASWNSCVALRNVPTDLWRTWPERPDRRLGN